MLLFFYSEKNSLFFLERITQTERQLPIEYMTCATPCTGHDEATVAWTEVEGELDWRILHVALQTDDGVATHLDSVGS